MTIKPSAAIRQNYNEISEYCKKTGEPVYLTKNGEGDLVVILVIERDRLNGAKYYSIEELEAELSDMIQRAEEGDVATI